MGDGRREGGTVKVGEIEESAAAIGDLGEDLALPSEDRDRCRGEGEREALLRGEKRGWSLGGGGGHDIEAAEVVGRRGVGSLLPGEDAFDCWFCMRQWILNQFDLLPYLEPDLDMPTMRHFLSLHALQAVLFFLSTTHLKLFLHSWITDWLLQVLPKKLLQPSQVNAPKWKPAAGSSHTRHCWFCIGSIFSSCNDRS